MNADEYFTVGLSSEYASLRQRCLSMTRNKEAADDLVQTICLEAWEHRHTLRDPERFPQWLSALAHNICKMWLRRESMQRKSTWSPVFLKDAETYDEDAFLSDLDLERDLEQKELALLLGRALGRLPPEAATLLTEHYLEEMSSRESAERRGLLPRTLEKRLERGKIAFRHLLQTDLHAELAPYLVNVQAEHWETTRLWCLKCGQHHLQACCSPGNLIHFRCPGCEGRDEVAITTTCPPAIKGYQRLLIAMMKGVERHYRSALDEASRPCPGCGRILPLLRRKEELFLFCPHCQTCNQNSLAFFALLLQEGRQFWQQNPRMHLLPLREANVQGRSALHVRYQSLENNATYEVFFARDTFEILLIPG